MVHREVVVWNRGIGLLTVTVHIYTVSDALHVLQCSWSVP